MPNIILKINDKDISNDDVLMTFSEISRKDKKLRYKDIIDFSLKNLLKNKNSLRKNLIEFENILNTIPKNIKFYYLWKKSPSFRSIDVNNPIKNLCIVIKTKDYINDYNVISLYVNIEIKNYEKKEFYFYLNRIEFLDDNLETNETFEDDLTFNFDFTENEHQPTYIYDIEKFVRQAKPCFDNDDYNTQDKLLLNNWENFLRLLFDFYVQKNTNEEAHNKLFLFQNELFLASKTRISNFDKNLFLSIDNEIKENYQIKSISTNEIKKDNLFQQKLNSNQQEINSKKNEINTLEDSLNKVNDEIKKYNNKISNLNSEIQNIKSFIKENEQNLHELERKIEKLKKERKDVSDLKENINKIEITIKNYKEKLTSLNDALSNDEKSLQIKKSQTSSWENNRHKLSSEIQILETEIQRLDNFSNHLNSYNLNLIYKVSISLDNDKNDCKSLLEDILQTSDYNDWISIDSNQKATIAKIKRYYFSTKQLNDGYYKNYNLFYSIKNPSHIERFKNKIPNSVLTKYKLNEKQQSAVNKAINANDLFYLQGPPGTGKTQTLCAITESIIYKNKNLAMCSSTHEAIDNFLERLYSFNKDNPNLVIFKYRFNNFEDKKENKSLFSQTSLFKNFKNSIYSFVIKEKQEGACKEFIEKYGDSKPEFLSDKKKIKLPFSYLRIIQNNLNYFNNNLHLLRNNDEDFVFPFRDYFIGSETTILQTDIDYCVKWMEKRYENLKRQDKEEYDKLILFDKAVDELSINNFNFNFLEDNIIQKFYYDNNKKNILQEKFSTIKSKFKSNDFDILETKFLDFIMENNLINVIGMTTSSRQSIEINNIKKNLFSDYSIDVMLIDEISKSSTPEILSKVVLSKKTILSGDYLQLPPSPEFNSDEELEELLNFMIDNLHKQYIKKIANWMNLDLNPNNEDKNSWSNKQIKIMKNNIEDLFKKSFFVIQVNKIKNYNSIGFDKRSYEFLQESRRFSGQILKLVNIIYDKNEQLIKVFDIKNKYDLKMNNKNLNNELVMIDYSNFDSQFFQQFHKINFKNNENIDSFDQQGRCIPLLNNNALENLINNSLYNQYSALIIINIINKLISQNQQKFNDIKIGVITLTKSQKNVIKKYRDIFIKQEHRKYIKIDTIDNFQGREEEIIIVDFIRGKNKFNDAKFEISKKRNLSFLEEVERINVAISRAKSKLIILGAFTGYLNERSIKEYGYLFKKYYDECKDLDSSYCLFKWDGGDL